MTPGERPDRRAPALRPPSGETPRNADSAARKIGPWLVLGILALLGIGVVFLLPRQVANRVPPPAAVAVPAPSVAPPVAAEPRAERRQAEQTLQDYLRLQAELKLMRAPAWARAQWDEIAREASRGDRLFGERRFGEAGRAYAGALAGLQALKDSRDSRLQNALNSAQQALQADDSDTAMRDFEQALSIEPDNRAATAGMARARARPRVLELVQLAEEARQAHRFEAARDHYQEALQLDPAFQAAQSGLNQVEQIMASRAFTAAMSEALDALDAHHYVAAGKALDRAAAIDPEAIAVADARERLRVARRDAAIADLRRQAEARVTQEDWQGAIERYRKALKIDERAGFAREGLAHATQQARINRQFDHYLDDPSRLYAEEPLANAEQLLHSVGAVPPDQPKLAAKREKLEALVQAAHRPLPVDLRSDGQTEVLIYHVGRLGRFVDRREELRPGTYTAVGTRPGYRDVRRVFTLRPGESPPTVDIRCEEPV